VHAAGLLVCNDDITSYCTVDANGIAHVEKVSAETLGLLKIDVLGLRTLGILEDSGVDVDWYNLKFDDPATYDIFNSQRLSCIFQFEGQAMRSLSKMIKFESMVEIDAITALARPGPFGAGIVGDYLQRKAGKPYESIHPLVQATMQDTCGLPLYQEQTMAIVRDIGKFNWEETSYVRKAISKRFGKEYFNKLFDKFIEGAVSQGISREAAEKTWDLVNSMGAWQMNKAHTYSYAVISYWTAYLKAHHPLEFVAANLRSARDQESATELLREMAKEGITHVPFDLKLSEENWCVKEGKLIGGFLALKGFGEVKAKKFVELRNKGALTEKHLSEIAAAENVFADIYPIHTKYKELYANPAAFNVASPITKIGDLDGTQSGSHVIIGEVIHKNPRDANEEVNVKKRGYKLSQGNTEFIDLRLRDDTGVILVRVHHKRYLELGRDLKEKVPEGAHLLVRADICQGLRFGFIQRWKRLDEQ
jgi:DNA polymerase III alpha subunit